MSQEEKTLIQIYREFAAADRSGRDHTLLLDAIDGIEQERFGELTVSPFHDRTCVRFVRLRILGVLQGAPAIAGCFVSPDPAEDGPSMDEMEKLIASLPEGHPPGQETIRAVLDSGLKTIIAIALFKNADDEWVRHIYHHPGLSKEEALSTARSFVFEADAPGPN